MADSLQHPARYRAIFGIAWPIMLANVAHPLLGLVDTAILGNLGSLQALGAIALGALIFSFLYWAFGFLRMGTTGFVAQAHGATQTAEVRAAAGRGVLLGGSIGVGMIVLQWPIAQAAFWVFDASAQVESLAADYVRTRFWGAPAALALLAINGTLIGLGRTRDLLVIQLALNVLNIALDILLAAVLGMGVQGVAAGTVLSEWAAVLLGLWMLIRVLRAAHADDEAFWPLSRLRDLSALRRTLSANSDILVRSLVMLFAFGWFTNQGAVLGDATLAANHILLQFITLSAYFLDGYAQAAESLIGHAVGRRGATGLRQFDAAVRASSIFAFWTALGLGLAVWWLGGPMILALTDLQSVQSIAVAYLPWCAVYITLSFAAFQLDGIFIGATGTRAMRNTALVSSTAFLAFGIWLSGAYGNTGLWLAFNCYVVLRALTLLLAYPALRRSIAE